MSVLWSRHDMGGASRKSPADEFDSIVTSRLLDVEWTGNQIIKMYGATPEDLIWSENREKSTSLAVGAGRDVIVLCKKHLNRVAKAIGESVLRGGFIGPG